MKEHPKQRKGEISRHTTEQNDVWWLLCEELGPGRAWIEHKTRTLGVGGWLEPDEYGSVQPISGPNNSHRVGGLQGITYRLVVGRHHLENLVRKHGE
jgi:hypothetical protein